MIRWAVMPTAARRAMSEFGDRNGCMDFLSILAEDGAIGLAKGGRIPRIPSNGH